MRFSTLFVAIFLFVVCVSSSPVTTANNETMHPEHSRSALNKRWRTFGPGYLPMQKVSAMNTKPIGMRQS